MLNPSNPLCFLPPELVFHWVMVARYIVVGTLAIFIWETLNNILNDYKLLFEHRIRLPTVVYFISRLCCLGYSVSTTLFQTAPAHTCYGFEKGLAVLFTLSTTSTSLLFFFRTRAVFDRNPGIIAFFAGLWLAVVAGCLTAIIGVNGLNLGSTKYCAIGQIKPYGVTAAIAPLINDTLVFLAITWRLCCNSYACRTLKDGFRILVFGDYMPVFSKAMLQDGQAYYLTTIGMNLITVIMLVNHSIPEILRTIVTLPNVTLMNIMACRVFRNTIFGNFRETQISTSLISRELKTLSPGELAGGRDSEKEAGDATFNINGTAITQTIERTYECTAQ